jgi:hypothetical protein
LDIKACFSNWTEPLAIAFSGWARSRPINRQNHGWEAQSRNHFR